MDTNKKEVATKLVSNIEAFVRSYILRGEGCVTNITVTADLSRGRLITTTKLTDITELL